MKEAVTNKRPKDFPVFSGIKKGSELTHKTLLGKETTKPKGDYRVTIGRPHKKVFCMRPLSDGSTYQIRTAVQICGVAKIDPSFPSYLELDILGYPPLFMELNPSLKEVA